jgi:sugar O-acyltransferase (sialic acid O-acetyltransferase NeuD family)
MTRPLVIIGAGGFAREVLQIALDLAQRGGSEETWDTVAFAVDARFVSSTTVHDLPVLSFEDAFGCHPEAWAVIAVGSPATRRRISRQLESRVRGRWATLVHTTSWLGRRVTVAPGSVICAGCQITTDISIGTHVHVNLGCTIGHDSSLADFTTLNPGVNVSGNVELAEGVEVGTGSILIPHANVGAWSIVGAGSVVTHSLDANVTAVGAPAKAIKSRHPGWHEANDI